VIDGEIKKVEAAASTVESEVKNVVGSIEKVL